MVWELFVLEGRVECCVEIEGGVLFGVMFDD